MGRTPTTLYIRIDSIEKAQLFGELGERFQITPRDDLSLDDFPTLRHVLGFLVNELGSRVADEGLAAAPLAAAVAEETAEAVTAAAPQWPQSFGALRVEVLEGTPREMGLQHGRALAAEIDREIASLVDATDAHISRNGELWQGTTLEELHGLADGAGINGEAVESWNFVSEPLAAWRTSFGAGGVDPGDLSSDSTTVVQVRRPVGGLPYLLVGKAGQVLPRAGITLMPVQACKAAVCQRDGARAKIRGAAPATLLKGRASDRLPLPCAELDACLFACGLYGYCMLERVQGVPSAVTRYRQARLPQPGEECVVRVFYRESSDRGSVYDFFLVGAAKDMILEVQGYQTIFA